jgi:hypothetical protein
MKKHDLALADTGRRRGQWRFRRLFVLLTTWRAPAEPNLLIGRNASACVSAGRAVGTRTPILVEARPNAPGRWILSMAQFANARRFRILNIVDDATRECLPPTPQSLDGGWRATRGCHRAEPRRIYRRSLGDNPSKIGLFSLLRRKWGTFDLCVVETRAT